MLSKLMNSRQIEFSAFFLLLVLALVGHYYLSWHCTISSHARYVLKFVWIMSMVSIGYRGLTRHQLKWIKYLWLIINAILIVAFGIDKLVTIAYNHPPVFGISSNFFTWPFPYLFACYIPRIIMRRLQLAKQ
jgi:hypothetical protein